MRVAASPLFYVLISLTQPEIMTVFRLLFFVRVKMFTRCVVLLTRKKREARAGLPVFTWDQRRMPYLLARALSASAISWKMPACFLAMMARMTSSVTIIRTTAMSRLTITFWIRPARMKLTKETPATVRA